MGSIYYPVNDLDIFHGNCSFKWRKFLVGFLLVALSELNYVDRLNVTALLQSNFWCKSNIKDNDNNSNISDNNNNNKDYSTNSMSTMEGTLLWCWKNNVWTERTLLTFGGSFNVRIQLLHYIPTYNTIFCQTQSLLNWRLAVQLYFPQTWECSLVRTMHFKV